MTKPRSGRPGVLSHWQQYLAISPFYLLFTVFMLIPVLFSLYLSFQRWDGLGEMKFVGLQQYGYLIHDSTFWLSLTNTLLIWVMSTVPMLFLALVLASLLTAARRFKGFYQVALFIPNITSVVAIAIIFGAMFSNKYGVVNLALNAIGLPGVPWMTNPWAIKILIALLMTWQWTGYNALIYYAGMQAIPSELYEAAKLDGAGPIRTFFSITVPMLRPIVLFTVVISTVTGMQSFTEAQVLFGDNHAVNPNSGGPGQAGLTMVLYFYRTAFNNNDYGYGAAIAWAVFLIVMVFTFLNWRLVQRRAD